MLTSSDWFYVRHPAWMEDLRLVPEMTDYLDYFRVPDSCPISIDCFYVRGPKTSPRMTSPKNTRQVLLSQTAIVRDFESRRALFLLPVVNALSFASLTLT